MKNKTTVTVKIDWLGDCPVCSHSEASVSTQGCGGSYLWSGDQATCLKCGHRGEIDADGENAWVEWDEVTNEQ